MIFDFARNGCPSNFNADFAIVGAGAVGLPLAVDLARRGHSVALLEAGGLTLDDASQNLFRAASSSGRRFSGLSEGRYRVLGGTTTFWGGQLVPLSPLLFEPRPWFSDGVWPIGRADLDRYYEKALNLLGLAQVERRDEDVWSRLGMAPPDLGEDATVFLSRWIPERNFSTFFRRDVDKNAALSVVINAQAVGFSLDQADGRVREVALIAPNGRRGTVSARHIVLTAGTIENARLMLLPLADGTPTPWSKLTWLGRGFNDHLDGVAATVTPLDADRLHNTFDNILLGGLKYMPKIALRDSAQRRRKIGNILAGLAFKTSYAENLANVKLLVRSLIGGRLPSNLSRLPSHFLALGRIAVPLVWRYLSARRIFNPSDGGILLTISAEQRPVSESRIRLAATLDSLGLPTVDLDWRVDERDIDTIHESVSVIASSLSAAGLAKLNIDPRLLARDPAFLDTLQDVYHHMGATRMATSPEDGVVDANLAVHGTSNLYIAGASVFPAAGAANPTFTAIALGLRLADHIAGR